VVMGREGGGLDLEEGDENSQLEQMRRLRGLKLPILGRKGGKVAKCGEKEKGRPQPEGNAIDIERKGVKERVVG